MEMLLEEKAVLCLDKIAECLTLPENKLSTFGYTNGLIGKVLFFTYYGAFTENNKYNDWAGKILSASIKKITEPYEGRSFYKELAEIGIFLEYAKTNNIIEIDTNAILLGIDKIMEEVLEKAMKTEDFDPYTGGLMAGMYFVARSNSKADVEPILEKITLWLNLIAHTDAQNNTYWVSKLFDKNNIYLGISHGLAIVITYLCKMYEMGIQPTLVKKMLLSSTEYLLSKKLDFVAKGYHFPDIVGDENGRTSLGLCYGDMGVAYALLRVGELLQNERLSSESIQIFKNCATRNDFPKAGIKDAGILYGASGVALIFDKIYEMTGITLFYDTATDWYKKITDFAVHENATAGFKGNFNQHFKHTNIAFMEGITGIGCTLIKYFDRENYCFDELIWML
ncbi:lanthionine synthetase-like protein [Arcicella aurantiaca]|uniref:Lanthionine synthetase-like protein n=1 Tax=Arcicella aurantiaca TaxID=591202 RepID=A0A316DIS0_9BACT|nr:lanthionine synthetase LanC family protein [Arcicella aurantiaca]PWK18081.1 lanthionine synthetase-like protein [Arcicella aurantiaca]